MQNIYIYQSIANMKHPTLMFTHEHSIKTRAVASFHHNKLVCNDCRQHGLRPVIHSHAWSEMINSNDISLYCYTVMHMERVIILFVHIHESFIIRVDRYMSAVTNYDFMGEISEH